MTQSLRQRWITISLANKLNLLCVALAALAAAGSAFVAVVQYRSEKIAVEIDQRPWLAVSGEHILSDAAGSPMQVTLEIKNFGKTPVIDLRFTATAFRIWRVPGSNDNAFEQAADRKLDTLRSKLPAPIDMGPIPPTGQDAMGLSSNVVVSADDLLTMQHNHMRIYIFGIMAYSDISRTQHETRFCLKVGGEPGKNPDGSGLTVHTCKYWNRMS